MKLFDSSGAHSPKRKNDGSSRAPKHTEEYRRSACPEEEQCRPVRPPRGEEEHRPVRPPRGEEEHRPARPPRGEEEHRPARPPVEEEHRPVRPPRGEEEHRPVRPPRGEEEHRPARPPREEEEYRPVRPPRGEEEHRPVRPPRGEEEHRPVRPPRGEEEHRTARSPRGEEEHRPARPPRGEEQRRPSRPHEGAKPPQRARGEGDFNRRMAENMGGPGVRKPIRKSQKKKILMVIGVVVACLVLLAVVFAAIYMAWSKPPEVTDTGLKTQTTAGPELAPVPAATPAPDQPEATPTPTPYENAGGRRANTYTILVVGRDRVGMNTDTIMLAMLDCDRGELNIVSIPRDTLVNVSWGVKKVNSIYGALGTDGLKQGIEDLIGYEIDNYVIVNTYVFQQLIDAIGGVYFDVPIYMYYDDPMQDLHIYLEPGYQWLNGNQAEQVVRFRQNNDGTGYPNGDLGRVATQQAFGMELAKQLLKLGNIANLPELINIVTSNTDTDLTSGNIAFYVEEFLKLSGDSIHFYMLPADSANIRGGSYMSIRLDEWLSMINSHFNPYNEEVTANNVNILMYGNGSTWSTTGWSQSIDSFYDYTYVAPVETPAQPPAEEAAPPSSELAPTT